MFTLTTRMPSNLRRDHPRMSTLTWWHSHANLTHIPWRYTRCAKMCVKVSKVILLHLRMRAFSYRRDHFRSRDKDGVTPLDAPYTKPHATRNSHGTIPFIEPELCAIKFTLLD